MRVVVSLLYRSSGGVNSVRFQRNGIQKLCYSTSSMALRRNNANGPHMPRESGSPANLVEKFHGQEQQHVKFNRDILDDLQTIQDVYRFAVTLYNKSELSYGHTTINAFDDASFLIMHELHLPIQDPVTQWGSARLTRQEREHLLNLIHLRASTKTPTAYLVKGCYQQGEYFHIDERALIPRSYLGEILMSKGLNIVGSNTADSTNTGTDGSVRNGGHNNHISNSSNSNSHTVMPEESRELDYDDYFGGGGDDSDDDGDVASGDGEDTAERRVVIPPIVSIGSTSHAGGDGDRLKPQHTASGCHTLKTQGNMSVVQQLDALYRRNKPQYLINTDKVHSVLDLCTGSGCLAILATKAFPHIERVDAVDISSDALEVAEANADLHGAEDVLTLYHGDLYAPLHEDDDISSNGNGGYGPSYDLIMANPPYVSDELMEDLPEEYTREPALALAAGHDGLEVIRKIMMHAHSHLNDGGGLLCEIGQCKQELMQAFPKLFGNVFYDDCDKPVEGAEADVKFIHGSSSRQKVHWIATACSTDEVFYVEKRYLTKKYLS